MKDTRWFVCLSLPLLLTLLLMAYASAPVVVRAAQQGTMEKSLYERLGGYTAIAAVVDDFVARLVKDKRFENFFKGLSLDSKKVLRQRAVDFICAEAGGPCMYTGRTMRVSHEGLGITEDDWQASVTHLVAALDKFKVQKREKDELLAAISKFKKDIVEK